MASHDMSCSAKKLTSYKKSIITAIIALLLIGSAVSLALSPFKSANAQKTAPSNRPLPGQGQQQPPQLEPEENVGNKVSNLQNRVTLLVSQLVERKPAFIGTSGNNVYITWSSNKTGNWEIMFKASTDSGKTLGPKINLSNDTSRSVDPQIAASGNNVYVTWWERNATSNEPVMRVSTDNGKTFGEKIMLSAK